jgi:hypothetical protein
MAWRAGPRPGRIRWAACSPSPAAAAVERRQHIAAAAVERRQVAALEVAYRASAVQATLREEIGPALEAIALPAPRALRLATKASEGHPSFQPGSSSSPSPASRPRARRAALTARLASRHSLQTRPHPPEGGPEPFGLDRAPDVLRARIAAVQGTVGADETLVGREVTLVAADGGDRQPAEGPVEGEGEGHGGPGGNGPASDWNGLTRDGTPPTRPLAGRRPRDDDPVREA